VTTRIELDNSHTRGSLYRTRNQRLPATEFWLITMHAHCSWRRT